MTPAFSLARTVFGRLTLTLEDGTVHEGVTPVRAFPLSAPDDYIALVSFAGRELVAIEQLSELPSAMRMLIIEELAPREFMPRIASIDKVSTFATPSIWQVSTDRGPCELVLKAEEDIRRLDRTRLLISDSHGLHFLIEDYTALDQRSKRVLERFL